ncbi:MAG: glycoside hydrolase family 9 protein, partial [Chitinispirillia bacterium]
MIPYFRILLPIIFILIHHIQITAQNQKMLNPPEIEGEAVYIPFPVTINIDGDLSDWKNIQEIKVDKGTFLSSDPEENSHFLFSIAADMDNLFITMRMPDRNIITGKHGTDYWNEDSFEFFLNCSENLEPRFYGDKIFQVNINPSDMGRVDSKLTLTGIGIDATEATITGRVFKTDDGWGFEAAVALENLIKPRHGLEIGFQAQANGASERDRDVKLIWSNADTEDISWKTPRVFGSALFFEVGKQDIPEPAPRKALKLSKKKKEPDLSELPKIRINQTGYYPLAKKRAVFVCKDTSSLDWIILQKEEKVMGGKTSFKGLDTASGDIVHLIDFSSFQNRGDDYVIQIGDETSFPFNIGNLIYDSLKIQSLAYFYLNRSGIPIEARYTERNNLARPAGHISDEKVSVFSGTDAQGKKWPQRDYYLNVRGGWYDAGDYGKYVVNGGISVWTLLNLYERNPALFKDGSLKIPENRNKIPDILDEVRWEMEFLINMQVPEGKPQEGMVHHKVHELKWDGIPVLPKVKAKNRYAYPPTTAATLNLAAAGAQSARIWKKYDAKFSQKCLKTAERAWKAALKNPDTMIGNVPGSGGGNYDDFYLNDEFFWAACELFITTGQKEYKKYLKKSRYFSLSHILKDDVFTPMTWAQTAMLGRISLITATDKLSNRDMNIQRNIILSCADSYIDEMNNEGYLVPIGSSYQWGSNSFVLNKAIIMAYAFELTGKRIYLNGVTESVDYIMGRNALCKSFVSGYGENPFL